MKHVIWSTLEDTRKSIPLGDNRMPTLMGKYKVPHFDAKAEANAYFTELGLPVTFLLTSFYWDNLIHFGMGPKKGPDGKLAFMLPMGDRKLPGIAASDIGACAYGIFKRGHGVHRQDDRHRGGVPDRRADGGGALEGPRAGGRLHRGAARRLPFVRVPGADDLGNMFQFKAEFENLFCGNRDLALSRSLNPGLQTFARGWRPTGSESPA